MKAIVTKYATTKGPVLMYGEVIAAMDHTFLTPGDVKAGLFRCYYHGYEWHTDKRSATDDILDRFTKLARNLRGQLARLEARRDKALKAIEGMELP